MELRLKQPIFDEISKKIASIEIDGGIELANITDELVRQRIKQDIENMINALRSSYDEQVQILKAGLEQIPRIKGSRLFGRILDVNLQIAALRNKFNRASEIEKDYLTYRKFYSMNRYNLLGCVLNNFKYNSFYGYYYNYYYYSSTDAKAKKREIAIES
jgi:hypothetical protein